MAIIRTIVVTSDTVKLDFWDKEMDFLRHKVSGGQGVEVTPADLERCSALVVESTVGKHHFVNADNSGMPVPADCGTIIVDSSNGPVTVVLADPALRRGIKRVTVVAVKIVHAIDVVTPTGPVFDTDNVVFHTEGASFTFGAVQVAPAEAEGPSPVMGGTVDDYQPPALPVYMPGTWAWYPVARYIPNFVYY